MPVGNVTIYPEAFAEEGLVRVRWTAPSHAVDHYSYRVYRRNGDLRTDWVLIAERTDLASVYNVEDHQAPAGTMIYTVVEVHVNNSVQTEDDKLAKDEMVVLSTPYYWLVHATDKTKTIQLRNVVADEFGNERETEVKKLIGRGRKVDVGDDWGKQGSIEGRIYDRADRTARQIRLDIEDAKDLDSDYWFLRNPFGDFWKIWWTDPSFSRMSGVGLSEFAEISFEYFEVA